MQQLLKIGDFVPNQPVAIVAPLARHHYMLRVVPNRELAVEAKLSDQHVINYLPKEQVSRKTTWNRRVVRTVAIFSGVIFIPDFEADLMRLKKIAGDIIGYVRMDSVPLRVWPKDLEQIRKFERLLDVPMGQRKRAFYVSQEVRIKGGSFDMWMAHVASLDSKRRLTVLVELLGRMVRIELDEEQVEAV